jgi:hypothetical protein
MILKSKYYNILSELFVETLTLFNSSPTRTLYFIAYEMPLMNMFGTRLERQEVVKNRLKRRNRNDKTMKNNENIPNFIKT